MGADTSRAFLRWGAGAVAAVSLAVPASAGAADVVSKALHEAPADVRAYWTPERMASARPASDLLRGVDLDVLPRVANERGKPWSIAGTAPERRAGLLDDLLGGGPSQSRRATQVAAPSKSPYRTHGKVFFSLGGDPYQCSATVVRARHKRLVATAGHCAYDGSLGGFATNWVFIPGKDGGSEPYGRWTARRLATTTRWANSTENSNVNDDDVRYDVAFAKMRKRKGRRLQNVVGARGIAFNLNPNHFSAFGYPAQGGFSGTEGYVCNSPNLGRDRFVAPPKPTRIACDMTGGSSGGGWVIGSGRVNSVTSYGYDCVPTSSLDPFCVFGNAEEDRLFGPYFGQTIKKLYRSQRGKRRR